MDAADLALRRPPVRRVRLALYLRSDEPLSGLSIEGLRSNWRQNYPSITELPPLPPDDNLHSDDDENSVWPLPFIVFESPGDGQRIVFQADRLAIDWEFSESGRKYPGFLMLRKELVLRFEQLVANLEMNQFTGSLKCYQVEVMYVNEVGHLRTLDVLNAQGLRSAGDKTYDNFTRHYHWGNDAAGWITYSDSPDEGADLRIRQQCELPETGDIDQWQALDACHDQVIEAFIEWTSEEMRSAWQ